MASKLSREEWARVFEEHKNHPGRLVTTRPAGPAQARVLTGQSEGMHMPPEPFITPDMYAKLQRAVQTTPNPCGEVILHTPRSIGKSRVLDMLNVTLNEELGKKMILTAHSMKNSMEALRGVNSSMMIFDEAARITGFSGLPQMQHATMPDGNTDTEDTMAAEPISTHAQAELEALCARINAYFNDPARSAEDLGTMLLGPANLTVDTGSKGYRKKNFVGGDHFRYKDVRVGAVKRGARLIFTLRPDGAADYLHMEMTDQEAINQLNDFRTTMNKAVGGEGYVAELQRIRLIDDKARADELAVKKMEEYKEFGAW